jgi:glycosyltransferase involved in cell wall biosynthesis
MDKAYSPTISVITAVFNAERTIGRTIQSVLSQSYKNIEYIIIDGGSTDGTVEILKKYSDSVDYWHSKPDQGIYDAWNEGLKKASGDWIAFLGGDDEFYPDAIQNYIEQLAKINYEQIDFISSKTQLVDSEGNMFRVIGKAWTWANFRRYMNVAHVGSLHSRDFFNRYGNYNLQFKIVGDYEMLLRARDQLRTSFINTVTVKMQVGGASNNDTRSLGEAYLAKITNDARTVFRARVELIVGYSKFYFRKWFLTP